MGDNLGGTSAGPVSDDLDWGDIDEELLCNELDSVLLHHEQHVGRADSTPTGKCLGREATKPVACISISTAKRLGCFSPRHGHPGSHVCKVDLGRNAGTECQAGDLQEQPIIGVTSADCDSYTRWDADEDEQEEDVVVVEDWDEGLRDPQPCKSAAGELTIRLVSDFPLITKRGSLQLQCGTELREVKTACLL